MVITDDDDGDVYYVIRLEIDWIRTHLLYGLRLATTNNNTHDADDSGSSMYPWQTAILNYPYAFKFAQRYSVDRNHSSIGDHLVRSSLEDAYKWCAKHFGHDSKLSILSFNSVRWSALYYPDMLWR